MRRLSLFWIGVLISVGYLALWLLGEGDGLGLIGVFGFAVAVLGGVLDGPSMVGPRERERRPE